VTGAPPAATGPKSAVGCPLSSEPCPQIHHHFRPVRSDAHSWLRAGDLADDPLGQHPRVGQRGRSAVGDELGDNSHPAWQVRGIFLASIDLDVPFRRVVTLPPGSFCGKTREDVPGAGIG